MPYTLTATTVILFLAWPQRDAQIYVDTALAD